jgi:hypothetical protein
MNISAKKTVNSREIIPLNYEKLLFKNISITNVCKNIS